MMKYLIVILTFLVQGQGQLHCQTLLFKSGFESTVQIDPPMAGGVPYQWLQQISGQDQGFDWLNDLPITVPNPTWQYLVHGDSVLSEYVTTSIDPVIGPAGSSTNALFMQIKKYSPDDFGGAFATVRTQFELDWDSTISRSGYSRYWMKFQPDLLDVMPPGSSRWRYIMEWRETGTATQPYGDYRWTFGLLTNSNTTDSIFWKLEGQFITGSNSYTNDWVQVNKTIPVPIGEWFLLEVYWNQKPDSTGLIWAAIDGTTILSYSGANMVDDAIEKWAIFKNYTGKESIDSGYIYQWIDDVEIWDSIPTGALSVQTEPHEVNKITVFPNPASSYFKVRFPEGVGNGAVLLYNSLGQLVYETSSLSENTSVIVKTDKLPRGVYYLKAFDNIDLLGVEKIVLE